MISIEPPNLRDSISCEWCEHYSCLDYSEGRCYSSLCVKYNYKGVSDYHICDDFKERK